MLCIYFIQQLSYSDFLWCLKKSFIELLFWVNREFFSARFQLIQAFLCNLRFEFWTLLSTNLFSSFHFIPPAPDIWFILWTFPQNHISISFNSFFTKREIVSLEIRCSFSSFHKSQCYLWKWDFCWVRCINRHFWNDVYSVPYCNKELLEKNMAKSGLKTLKECIIFI